MRYNTNMFNSGYKLSRNIIIALGIALVVVVALVAISRYFIIRDKRSAEPKPLSQPVLVSDEVLRSLTPPEGATSTPVSQAVLDSLTPPKDAKPTEIPQSVLDSLTPPAK